MAPVDQWTTLPHLQRRAIDMAYFGRLTHTEIAARLHVAPGSIKDRLRLGWSSWVMQSDRA